MLGDSVSISISLTKITILSMNMKTEIVIEEIYHDEFEDFSKNMMFSIFSYSLSCVCILRKS